MSLTETGLLFVGWMSAWAVFIARTAGFGNPELISSAAAAVPPAVVLLNVRSFSRREHHGVVAILCLFGLWAAVSTTGAMWGRSTEVLIQATKLFSWGCFLYSGYLVAYRRGDAGLVLSALGWSALPVALNTLYGVWSGTLYYNPWQGQLSFEGTSINKSMVHVALSAACLWLAMRRSRGWFHRLSFAGVLLYGTTVLLANARVAQIGLAVLILTMFMRSSMIARAVMAAGTAGVLSTPFVYDRVFLRWSAVTSGEHAGTLVDRLVWWQRGVQETLRSSPLFGLGKSIRYPFADQVFPFHSILVQSFVESGFAGFSLLVVVGLASGLLCFRALAKTPKEYRWYEVAMLFAMFWGMSLTENTYLSGHQNWVFWGAVGAIAGEATARHRAAVFVAQEVTPSGA